MGMGACLQYSYEREREIHRRASSECIHRTRHRDNGSEHDHLLPFQNPLLAAGAEDACLLIHDHEARLAAAAASNIASQDASPRPK